MPQSQRIAWAVALVAIDFVAFALPLVAIVAACVLLARPPWFREFVEQLYADAEAPPS